MPASSEPKLILSDELEFMDATSPKGYITSIDGKLVKIESRDVVGCLADHFFLAKSLNVRGADIQSNLLYRASSSRERAQTKNSVLFSIPHTHQNQNAAQIARYYAYLAAACDKYNVKPVDVMGPVAKAHGAKRGYLCNIEYYDPVTMRPAASKTLNTAQDMMDESETLSRVFAQIQQNSPNIDVRELNSMRGTTILRGGMDGTHALAHQRHMRGNPEKGMGIIPLLLALPYAGYLVFAVVMSLIALAAYSVRKVCESWTASDKMNNELIASRYKCLDEASLKYAQAKTSEEASRWKLVMEKCEAAADKDRDKKGQTIANLAGIFSTALVGVALYGGYKIYMNRQAQNQTERVANGKTYDAEYSMSDSGLYLPR